MSADDVTGELSVAVAALVAARDALRELPTDPPWDVRQRMAELSFASALSAIDDIRAALEIE